MSVSNVGRADAAVRATFAFVLLAVAAAFNDRPLLAVGSGFLAVVLLGTALFRVCPLYTAFGIRRPSHS